MGMSKDEKYDDHKLQELHSMPVTLCLRLSFPELLAMHYTIAQNPKLSNSELDSGSSNTLGGGLWPAFISTGSLGTGRSATTSDERLRSIRRGSGPLMSLKTFGTGKRNSQLRTSEVLVMLNANKTDVRTEIQSQQIAAHPIIQTSIVDDKRPFDFRRDLRRTSEGLKRHLA
jgi:hypothetical protein